MRPLLATMAWLSMLIPAGARTLRASPPSGDQAKAFQENVRRWTQEDGRYIEAWWEANLDADPKLERVALLCDTAGDDKKGVFLIEKDTAHRWELSFDVDARTKACQKKPDAPPPFEQRKSTTIALEQARHDGYTKTEYAIRVGQPVIVREEEVADASVDPKPVVKDWDLLIKKKKEKNYQLPEGLRPVNR